MEPNNLRATDQQRNRVTDELVAAFDRGQLSYSELEERKDQAWKALTQQDLADILVDISPDPFGTVVSVSHTNLPAVGTAGVPAEPSQSMEISKNTRNGDPSALAKAQVTGRPGGSSLTVAVMFGSDQKGAWLVGPTHTAVAVMGGITLDLRQAQFSSRRTEIFALAFMGGIEVIVPEDMQLTVDGHGFMGGFESNTAASSTLPARMLPADAPEVIVHGVGFMGGVEVTRVPRPGGYPLPD